MRVPERARSQVPELELPLSGARADAGKKSKKKKKGAANGPQPEEEDAVLAAAIAQVCGARVGVLWRVRGARSTPTEFVTHHPALFRPI